MTWTGFWGKQIRRPVEPLPGGDVERRTAVRPAGPAHSTTPTEQTVPWAMENTPMPMSGDHAEHMNHGAMHAGPAAPTSHACNRWWIWPPRARSSRATASPSPTTAEGVFTIAVFANDPRNDATLHVDQYTGKVLADVRWQHYNRVARATETGVMLHEGKMFGWVNQLIVLVICLMILLSAVSGVVIWWKRRPQGGLGVPPLRHDLPKWKTAMVIMLGLAIIFPLVGASLIAVWALDRLVLSRFFGPA